MAKVFPLFRVFEGNYISLDPFAFPSSLGVWCFLIMARLTSPSFERLSVTL